MAEGRCVMNIANEMVREVAMEIPEGHRHLRITVLLHDGTELVFQEATIANISRAYVSIKTHPQKSSVHLKGKALQNKKQGFADWQLLED
jgi:hypothetical protein